MRKILILLAMLALVPTARAADSAHNRAIGYSQDGAFFAFEQYGVQDGSGFPFWEIHAIDLAADSWLPGTPVRIMIEDDGASLATARDRAHQAAAPVLQRFEAIQPSALLLANPATETLPDRTSARFDAYYNSLGPDAGDSRQGRHEISVRAIHLPRPEGCTDPAVEPRGMEVILRNLGSGREKVIARDAAIPASRHCPAFYDIDSVHAPASYGTGARHVALIGYYARGFEGWNRRVIAIPFDLGE